MSMAFISYENNHRMTQSRPSEHTKTKASGTLSTRRGFMQRLRERVEKWRAKRRFEASIKEILSLDAATLRDISSTTPAEMAADIRRRTGQVAQPHDVVAGPVLVWPAPHDNAGTK